MELTVLGCRSGLPAEGRASSGYLVDSGTTRLLLDCGPGVATALSAVTRAERLDGVIISHLHIDHCYDLLPIGKSLLSGHISYPGADKPGAPRLLPERPKPRETPLPLYLPVGGRELLEKLVALFPLPTIPVLNRTLDLAFDVHEYAPGDTFRIGDCDIELALLAHSLPNCGMRVESPDGSLVYTGDTGLTDSLAELAQGADLLLAEATLGATDHGPHGHLSGTDCGQVAAAAGVGKLVLTHFVTGDPEWLADLRTSAQREYDGEVALADSGARYRVGAPAEQEREASL